MLDIATQPSATSRWKNRPRPPAPEPLKSQPGPLKMFRILRTSPIEGLTSAHFQYPIVVSSTVIGKMTFVSCPKAIRHVLIDNSENYRRDRIQQRMVKLPFGQSLLAAEGDKWRNQRRWIRPAFSRESLSEAAQNMAAAAAMLVGRWQTFAAGSRLDISLEMHKAMMSLLERTLFLDGFGRDFEEMLRYLGREFDLTARIGLLDLLNVPAGVPRMVTVPLRPVLAFFARMTSDVIATRERRLAASPLTPPNDLVTVLLRAHGSRTHRALTKQEVASNIHLFFAAADEASANALCWVLYLLGLDPEWRERVEMEADRKLPDGRYVEGSLERLVATRAVIEERTSLSRHGWCIDIACFGMRLISSIRRVFSRALVRRSIASLICPLERDRALASVPLLHCRR
jgi:cytochrome P450